MKDNASSISNSLFRNHWTSTKRCLALLVLISATSLGAAVKDVAPEPPVGGQGSGGTGGTGGNAGGYAAGSTGITSSPLSYGRGTTVGGNSCEGPFGSGPIKIACVIEAMGAEFIPPVEDCNCPGGTPVEDPVDSTCDCNAVGAETLSPAGRGYSCLAVSPGSCFSCGTVSKAKAVCDQFVSDDVVRYSFPYDQAHNSSLSPGFYTQYDSQLHLFQESSGSSIYFFDVFAGRTFKFVDGFEGDTGDGVFHDVSNGHARHISLLDQSGNAVTSIAQATSVKVTHWNGATEVFEVIDLDPSSEGAELAGRLKSRLNRNGYGHDVTYKAWTSTEVEESPSRLWQIAAVADDWGNSLSFSYNTLQQSGRWAVSQVTRHDSATISFAYNAGRVASVTLPGGAQTLYTFGQDSTSQTATIRIQEAAGKAKDLIYHLTNDYMTVGNSVISQPSGIHRMVKTPSGDVDWLLIPNSDPSVHQDFVFTGGNRAILRNGDGSYQQYQSWSCTTSGGYASPSVQQAVLGIEGTLESQVAGAGAGATLSQLYLGTISTLVSQTGRVRLYEYDADRNITKVTYPADGTHEDYSYNSFGQVTRKRSRTGDVELITFDSKGNLLTHTKGLKEVGGADQQTVAYSQSSKEYYPMGGVNAGLLKTEKSALYNASTPTLYRTDYEYDSNNRLTKKIGPAPAVGQARPETEYEYSTSGKLAQVTDSLYHVTSFTYNSAGNQTQVTFPDASTEQTLYGTGANAGRVVATKDRVGTVTTYSYDSSGRLVQTVVGAAIDANILDGNAHDQLITDPNLKQVTEYTYLAGSDSFKSQVKNNGTVIDYVIDFNNRVTEVKQYPRAGITLTSKNYYLENQLLCEEDAYGRRKYYGYRESDGTLIRTVTCTHPDYTLADFDAVWNLTRSASANAAYIIHDAIRDDAGHLTQVIDGRGTETRYEYDSHGRETKKTAAYGTSLAAVAETDYDADGRVIEIRSPRFFDSNDSEGYQKAKESWTYDGAGRVATHTVAAGSSIAATESFSYFADGRQQSHTDYRGKVWTKIDDTCCGKSTASKNPLGHGSIRNTDPQRRVVHSATVSSVDSHTANMLDPINGSTLAESTTKYDLLGRIIATTTWLSARGQIDPLSPPIAGLGGVAQSEGLTTQYLYDDNLVDGIGLDSGTGVSPAILPASNGSWRISLTSAIGKLAAAETTGGAALSFNSSAPGRALVVINPEFEVTFTISDAVGRTVMSGKLAGVAGVPAASDPNSLLAWSCQAHDTVTAVGGFGNCLEYRSIDALGNVNKSLSDGAGRTLRSIDQLGNATVFTYDAGSNQLSVRDPNGFGQDVVYDALSQAGLTTDTANHTTNSIYDKAGNRIATIDGKGQTTSFKFDARGRLKSQTDRIAGVTSYAYLTTGQLASLTDAESQTTSYTYDDAGGKLTEQYPDHTGGSTVGATGYGIVTFTLDAAGRVFRKQDQKGDTVTFNYDLAGRLSTRDYRTAANSPSGTIADNDQFSYDNVGRILTAYSGRYVNTLGYSYDAAGRRKTESLTIAGQTYTTSFEYSARGELTKYTYPDNAVVERSYTARGELFQLKHAGTTVDTRAYDNGGRLSSSTYNNGVVDTRTYGANNTLSSITFTGSGTSIGNLSYSWDNNQNKISETITGTMTGYGFNIPTGGYDNEDRLVSFNRNNGLSQSWSLSPVGDWSSVSTNGTAQIRTHGSTHELLTGGGQNVSTDVKGNITAIPSSLRSSTTSLTSAWDFENRLVSATTGSTTVSHQYDALGRRVARTSGGSTTVYVQAGQQTIADYASGAAPASSTYRYLYASYIDEPVMRWQPSSGTAVYFHRNQQYSITALTDSTGAVLERYAYTAYGAPTIANASGTILGSSAHNNRYTYTGREWDSDIQQYHYRARMYDPELGQFCSRDPIGFRGSKWNLFKFLNNAPLHHVDQFGLEHNKVTVTLSDGSKIEVDCEKPDPPKGGTKPESCTAENLKESKDDKCKSSLESAMKDESVKKVIDKLKSLKCDVPEIQCKDCCGPCKAGAWHFSDGTKSTGIYICDGQKFDSDMMTGYLRHELTHAIQSCRKDPDKTCMDRLKMELEAYKCQGHTLAEAIKGAVWSACWAKENCTLDIIKDPQTIKDLEAYWKTIEGCDTGKPNVPKK